jgi:hypothetical protein
MENFSQLIGDRITKHCGKTEAELLKFCQLQMVVVQEKSALLICCPNAWTADRLNDFFIGNLDLILHSMGIEQVVLDDSEGMKSYYQWDTINLSFKGYFLDGDLTKLKIVNIPSIEELENMRDNQ